jgi:hypothetical protein
MVPKKIEEPSEIRSSSGTQTAWIRVRITTGSGRPSGPRPRDLCSSICLAVGAPGCETAPELFATEVNHVFSHVAPSSRVPIWSLRAHQAARHNGSSRSLSGLLLLATQNFGFAAGRILLNRGIDYAGWQSLRWLAPRRDQRSPGVRAKPVGRNHRTNRNWRICQGMKLKYVH